MPVEIHLTLLSMHHQTRRRRGEIGAVIDRFPQFAPDRVGGDPPRQRVTEGMETLLRSIEGPVDLIGARDRRHRPDAIWFLDLADEEWWVGGRDGEERVLRAQSTISMVSTVTEAASEDQLQPFVRLMAELGDAVGAAYGFACSEEQLIAQDRWHPDGPARPSLTWGLCDIFWLQYFGPAFVARYPALAHEEVGERTPRGAVIHRAADAPPRGPAPGERHLGASWKQSFLAVLGPEPFGSRVGTNPALPEDEEYIADDAERTPVSPSLLDDVQELRAEAERRAEIREQERAEAYRKGRIRRLSLDSRRPVPMLPSRPREWSTNVDADEVTGFWKRLRRDAEVVVSGPYSGALLREIANCPEGVGGSVTLDSAAGPFELAWYADDHESLILSVRGTERFVRIADRSF